MCGDAIEVEDGDEVTWQSYKGPVTAEQDKLCQDIRKRKEQSSTLSKEIHTLQVKDISQRGLTQDQQNCITRNEHMIKMIAKELEFKEKALNASIRQSICPVKISHWFIEMDYDSWISPERQSHARRTFFNDRLNLDILARKMGRHRWFLPFVPQVQTIDTKVPLREKVRNTLIYLFIYLVCSQLPLFGIHSTTCVLPSYTLYWEHILGSRCGTVMQVGMIPILASRIIVQIFLRLKHTSYLDIEWEDRVVINAAQKIIAIMLGLYVAVLYVLSGMYGSVDQLGVGNCILIIFQLWFAGIIVICSDELLQKGYGLGSGISLFGAASICGNIMWKTFSPMTINNGQGVEYEGCVIALFHLLITRTDKAQALHEAFFRQNLHNVTNLLATISIFLIVIYLQGLCVFVPLTLRNAHGQLGSFQIKYFYTSNLSILLLSGFLHYFHYYSKLLHTNSSYFVSLLGKWNKSEYGGGHLIPVGGIAYYTTAPSSLADMAANPFRALFYLVFLSSNCARISYIWTRASLSSPYNVVWQCVVLTNMYFFSTSI